MAHISVTAAENPERPAIIMGNSGEVVTYKQLDERSNQGAHLFRSLGLQNGDHIGMMVENCRQFLEIVQAALRSGIIFTPISTHLRSDETRYILDNCNAKLFIGSKKLATVAGELHGELPQIQHYFMLNGADAGFESWDEVTATMPTTPIADESMGTPMLYSSGTTGQPKGVLAKSPVTDIHETHPNLAAFAAIFGFNESTRYLSPAPLYHAAPMHYNNMLLGVGGTTVVMEKFDAERALQLIQEQKVTHSQWVPIMFIRMLKLPEATRQKYDCSSMQVAIHAAAPCPIEIKEKMIDWWGEVIFEYYSGSEGSGMTIIDSASWLTHKGSVGPAISGELHIVGEDGEEVATGETGTIYIGNGNPFEYYNEPEKTAGAYNKKGWSTLGDVGYVDEDGFLYLTDRKNFMIISGGVNIYPQEIENLLINHEQVADVAVFGIPNEEFGEEVKAVVQPVSMDQAGDELSQQLLEWCKERLATFKVPRSVDFMEQLPRMENGKLYKRHLADAYRDGKS
ncbi:acyl-CoA synthetase [Halieaceae bacterium IMCC14734]|uniref:Acyl-CoA synthetase n=1 Tax=Candidatus Litorirhabdus singularis TaxID=2518993 RepID=A0ABT3TFT2_9GAMM|nr:acyl-CoA synthetase [Candidatus Litorirhabdus singularis]MCX2981075.1 acyl-CoA synthetase [Candidatus Litorirhabdus singularis]